jgi:GntR family transcriptional regulator
VATWGKESEEAQWSIINTSDRLRFPRESHLKNMTDREFNDSQPIYRQLRDRVVAMILDGVLKEGDPLPSVRNVAAEYRVNPLTVLKGYQQLVDEQLVETKRGRGMFINAGARNLLLQGERQKFLAEEWPRVSATIQRLGLTPEDLLDGANHRSPADDAQSKAAQKNSTEEEPKS